MAEEVLNVVKSGEPLVQTRWQRTAKGFSLWIKASHELEEFIKGLGDGAPEDPTVYDRYWAPRDSIIRVYPLSLKEACGTINPGKGVHYCLDAPGSPLLLRVADPEGRLDHIVSVNLSWLRLVGISDPNGVRIIIRSVVREETIDDIISASEAGITAFYRDFMKPIDLSLIVSIQNNLGS